MQRIVRALTKPLDVFAYLNNLQSGFMQKRNFGGFPFGNATQNEGVGVIFGNGVVNEADAIVCGLFDVLRDVGIVVLRSRCSRSVKIKVRRQRWVAHIEYEVGTKVLNELVVTFGSSRNDFIPGKLGQLDCILSNR